jgi:hypothetical protein
MASQSSFAPSAAESDRASSPAWLYAKELWAGLSIITMWIAVLFVGVFGGDFVSSSTTNGFTKIPVVVFLIPFVLVATVAVARRAFTRSPDERHGAPEEETRERAEQRPEPSSLRAKHA